MLTTHQDIMIHPLYLVMFQGIGVLLHQEYHDIKDIYIIEIKYIE